MMGWLSAKSASADSRFQHGFTEATWQTDPAPLRAESFLFTLSVSEQREPKPKSETFMCYAEKKHFTVMALQLDSDDTCIMSALPFKVIERNLL